MLQEQLRQLEGTLEEERARASELSASAQQREQALSAAKSALETQVPYS